MENNSIANANPVNEEVIKSKFINGDIDILIVVDKLLTGFDAPKASTLYLDKQIKKQDINLVSHI